MKRSFNLAKSKTKKARNEIKGTQIPYMSVYHNPALGFDSKRSSHSRDLKRRRLRKPRMNDSMNFKSQLPNINNIPIGNENGIVEAVP